MRTILTWRLGGEDLVGTYHVPHKDPWNVAPERADVGVLLLNAGAAPRAGNSDLSVHVSDGLARRGFAVFRFDFAGLGDSSGPTPADTTGYWEDVVAGRNDEATLLLLRRIRREFALPRLYVGGLCAAALPAIRAADRKLPEVEGLILLEPAFHRTMARVVVSAGSRVVVRGPRPTKLRRALSLREWLLYLTGENPLGRSLGPLRDYLLGKLRRVVGHTLPMDTHLKLVRRWQRSLERGSPTLIVAAEGQRTDCDLSRILQSLPDEAFRRVSVVRVPRTNHILTSGDARRVVVDAVGRWVVDRSIESPQLAAAGS